ncbi:hypothetical protein DHEL01_v207405 [Diaporthe helianthi]|uniref:Major facilitator superfamily (MFS) profile domain-containing protein n=1 Tax=Diaporthe helianthi TaxID=158607 RepID=A0A2P5HVB1_DIAHE|nr:hypothetical protein DHEL01_v207405 [Diaporthe helianthi]
MLTPLSEEWEALTPYQNPQRTYDIPMVASSYVLAATVVSALVFFLGMPLGRRGCILMGNGLVIVGSVIQATAFSMAHIIVGRVICIDFGTTRSQSQASWRFPIAFQSFFAFLSGTCLLFLPDTPRWYYARARIEEGDAVLALLNDQPTDHPQVQEQKRDILRSIQMEAEDGNKLSLLSLVWDNTELRVGRRIRISFLILSIQQMMGINMLVYFSTRIFANIGLTSFMSQLLAAVMNTCFAIGTYFTPGTIETYGRRAIMLWSAVVLGVSMLIFTVMIALPNPTLATQWTAIGFIIIYNLAFGYGWVGCPWLYGPEIAPLRYRHIAGAAGSLGEWLFSFITVFAGGIGAEVVGWRIWIWQITFCIIAVVFVYFCCPETKGKTLEEIDEIFAKAGAYHDAGVDEKVLEGSNQASDVSHLENPLEGDSKIHKG